jgi:hypothetical protein
MQPSCWQCTVLLLRCGLMSSCASRCCAQGSIVAQLLLKLRRTALCAHYAKQRHSVLSWMSCAALQVSHANQLLSVYRAFAALRADEEFQEDAADPEVQAALQDMGRHNNMEK